MRFHAPRPMSVGERRRPAAGFGRGEGGRDPAGQRRVIGAFTTPRRYSMMRDAVAPCTPFSVSHDLMRESAALARGYGRAAAHAPGRERLRPRLRPEDVRPDARRIRGVGVGWLERRRLACTLRLARRPQAIGRFAADRHRRRALPVLEHAPRERSSRPSARCSAAGVPVGLGADGAASNDCDAPAARTPGWRCCRLRVRDTDPAAMTALRGARGSARGAARACSAATTSACSRPAKPPTSLRIDLDRPQYAGMLGTIPSRRWCSARRRASHTR